MLVIYLNLFIHTRKADTSVSLSISLKMSLMTVFSSSGVLESKSGEFSVERFKKKKVTSMGVLG